MSIFHGSDAARSCRWVVVLMKSWQCWDASSISFRAWYIIQSVDDIASNLFLLGVCLHYIASNMIQCTNIQMLRSGISNMLFIPAWNDEPQLTHSVGWCETINQLLCLMASYGGNPSGHLRRPPTNSRSNRNEHRMNMIINSEISR